jgi:hypothetical protein
MPFWWKSSWDEPVSLGSLTEIVVTHRYNDVLLTIMFVRVYLFIRFILSVSYYMSGRAQRVCGMNSTESSYVFAIRCMMKANPYLSVAVNLLCGAVLFAYCVRIFDQGVSKVSG